MRPVFNIMRCFENLMFYCSGFIEAVGNIFFVIVEECILHPHCFTHWRWLNVKISFQLGIFCQLLPGILQSLGYRIL